MPRYSRFVITCSLWMTPSFAILHKEELVLWCLERGQLHIISLLQWSPGWTISTFTVIVHLLTPIVKPEEEPAFTSVFKQRCYFTYCATFWPYWSLSSMFVWRLKGVWSSLLEFTAYSSYIKLYDNTVYSKLLRSLYWWLQVQGVYFCTPCLCRELGAPYLKNFYGEHSLQGIHNVTR